VITWAGDMARVVRESVEHLGRCDLTTVTPPGFDVLPWDRKRCTHAPDQKCSGAMGCKIEADALARWHAAFRPALDRLLRSSREALRRRGHLMPPYVLVLEPQARGALHLHLATSVRDRVAAHLLHELLAERVERYGFGGRVAWDPARGQHDGIGSYITKLTRYLTKEAAGESLGLREILAALPGRRVFSVSTKITGETRSTMRNCRRVRWAWATVSRRKWSCAQAEMVWLIDRESRERRQAETTFVVMAEVAFGLRGPPPGPLGRH
jgi:hypothetical protein